jgi:RimJ/RimL family protein N-acetyltransferase
LRIKTGNKAESSPPFYVGCQKASESVLPLYTDRLILRRFADDDQQALAAYRNDPEVARYQSWEHCTPSEARLLIAENKNQPVGVPGEWINFAIALRDRDELVGDLALQIKERDAKQAVLGFTIARSHQRQGLGSEAVGAVLDYLFASMALHRVTADCDPRNEGSWRLMERLGMRREGHFIRSLWFKGDWADEYIYAILHDEWKARREKRR